MPDETRITLNKLGEYYTEMLRQEAFIMDNALSAQAGSLLRNFLNMRTESRDRKLSFLAWRRGITVEELKRQIGSGEADQLSMPEYIKLQNQLNTDA